MRRLADLGAQEDVTEGAELPASIDGTDADSATWPIRAKSNAIFWRPEMTPVLVLLPFLEVRRAVDLHIDPVVALACIHKDTTVETLSAKCGIEAPRLEQLVLRQNGGR